MKLWRSHRFCHSWFVKSAFQFIIVCMIQQRSPLYHIKFTLLLLLLLLHHSHYAWGFIQVGKLCVFDWIPFLGIRVTSQRQFLEIWLNYTNWGMHRASALEVIFLYVLWLQSRRKLIWWWFESNRACCFTCALFFGIVILSLEQGIAQLFFKY